MLSIVHDGKILPIHVEYFCFDEKINEDYDIKLRFFTSEKIFSRLSLREKLDINFLGGHTVFGYITCFDKIMTSHDAILIELRLSSSLFQLKRKKKRRSFIDASLADVFSELFSGLRFELGLSSPSSKIDWVQYDETDFDCLKRFLSYLGVYLYFDFSEKVWHVAGFSGLRDTGISGYYCYESVDSAEGEQNIFRSEQSFSHLGRFGQKVIRRSTISWSGILGMISEKMVSEKLSNIYIPVVLGLQKIEVGKEGSSLTGRFLWNHYANSRINKLSICMPGYTHSFYCKALPREKDCILLDFESNDFCLPVILSGLSFTIDQSNVQYENSLLDLSEKEKIIMASSSIDVSADEVRMAFDSSHIQSASSVTVAGKTIVMTVHQMALGVGGSYLSLDNRGIDFSAATVIFDLCCGSVGSLVTEQDAHQCPLYDGKTPHQGGPVLSGATDVKINGLGIARDGDRAYCQGEEDRLISKVVQFKVNGKAVVVDRSRTQHGGCVFSTQQSVFIC